jgi:dTDP-glucose 4,6-dehydratase
MHVRDWLYVEDHCEALYLILTKGNVGEKYNIGGNGQRTNLYVVNTVLAMLNKPKDLVVHVEDRKGHDFRYALSGEYMKQLGWEPKYNFDTRIEQMVKWTVKNDRWLKL